MANQVANSYFPSQVASDSEKLSPEYGLKVAQAIQREWFSNGSGTARYRSNQSSFHNLRLYARGEQSIQKYKDELSINGDLSYLNLDWKPVPVLSKFVDIVVNGIADRSFDLKAYSQDPYGVAKRTAYVNSIVRDMQTKEINDYARENFGINLYENDPATLPETKEELELHMQLSYKQSIEIAEETAINTLFDGNNYDLTKRRVYYDLATIGIGAVKNNFSPSKGITVDYVDPADIVYSYTESPYFDDIYYVGEVKQMPLNELVSEFPHLTLEEIDKIKKTSSRSYQGADNEPFTNSSNRDSNIVSILYFNYKTFMNEVYKTKKTATGADKAIPRDDQYNPPADSEEFGKLSRSIEVLYDGAIVLGTEQLLKWELCTNMMRPKSEE